MSEAPELDTADRQILDLLQADGRRTHAELGVAVGLAASTVHERVRRMERAGVLRATVLVDPDAVGLPLLAFTFVALSDPEAERGFLERIGQLRQVLECHHVTGEWNYLLKIRASGTRDLERVLSDEIKVSPGIVRTLTTIVMSSTKDSPAVPALAEGIWVPRR